MMCTLAFSASLPTSLPHITLTTQFKNTFSHRLPLPAEPTFQHDVGKPCRHARLARRTRSGTIPSASAEGPDGNVPPPSQSKDDKSQMHVTVELARSMDAHALALANGDRHAVAQVCARGFVNAFQQRFNNEDDVSVFIVCGPGMNGLIGLHIAVLLQAADYEPAVYSTPQSACAYVDVVEFTTSHNIPLYDFVPSTLSFYFSVIVDALLGTGFDGGDLRAPFWNIFQYLVSTQLPVASVDVPSGWDLTLGPRQIDRTADTFVKPDLLVSLGAPKLCALQFKGAFHFLAGRHVPPAWLLERGLLLPAFPGDDAHAVLLHSLPQPFGKLNGEVFAKPGAFNATAFTKNPQRKWVDLDDDESMDLWDELD